MDLGDQAKQTLKSYVPQIDKRIDQYLDSEVAQKFGFNARQKQMVQLILDHSREFILRPTKRVRASFVNYGFLLSGNAVTEEIWQTAVGVELVHAAILIQDDIMDLDERRRGGLTTHKYFQQKYNGGEHFGHSMAINVSDVLLCLGFELIEKSGSSQAMLQMLRSVANTAYGQAYDVSLESLGDWTENDVLTLHKAKTAIYTYENPLFIGANLARLPKRAFDILHDYSMDGGVAFQLRDDILGVFGDPSDTGKSADSDLLQGKCTLLVLKALDKSEVRRVWGNKSASQKDIQAAKEAIRKYGSLEYSLKLVKKLARQAAHSAEKLRDLKLNSFAIDYLQGIALYMAERVI